MMEQDLNRESPPWGPTTKLVVGLTFVAIVAALLIRFRNIIGPLLLAFILAYVLHPLVDRVCTTTRLNWRTSVNLVYLVLVVLLLGLSTLTGLAVVQQLQSLVIVVQRSVADLPDIVSDLTSRVYAFGIFRLDFSQLELTDLTNQLLDSIQPLLRQIGSLVRTFATGAVGVLVWGAFTLLVSYFVLADSGRWFPQALVSLDIPGHQRDVRRLGRELARIWNAFLRGQLILFLFTVLVSVIVLSILGLRFALGLALLAGVARFVPYVGPFAVWTTAFLVAAFQESNYLGFTPMSYALVIVLVQLVIDQIFDNYLSPRILGQTLGVHPAAVMVSAIVATNLIGLVGLLLAAPVLATFLLIGRYAIRKMLEVDPWPTAEPEEEPDLLSFRQALGNILSRLQARRRKGAGDD